MKNIKKLLQLTIVLLALSSQANAVVQKWAPIILGDITTFVPYFADDLPIPVDTSILLTSGQAQTNIADRGAYVYYKVYAHAGDVVKVDLYDMDANGNLYVKIGSQASLNSYDCKSENGGETHSTENDSCSITMPSDGYVYMAVYAPNYGCYNNVKHTIKVSINPIVYGQEGIHDVSTRKDADAEYKIYYPSDIANMDKIPLIFFCPGWGGGVDGYISLLRFMASHGYVVVIAKDSYGVANNLIPRFEKMLSVHDTIYNHLDKSRIGVVGHSSGGGNTFKILDYYSKKGYGENGRLLMALDPYFAYGMSEASMKQLPSNTNLVLLQFGNDGGWHTGNNTDPRIPLSEYKLLESIPNNQKDYQVYTKENANHGYPSGNKKYSDMQGVLQPLDALMAYTFENKVEAHDIALEIGSDTPLADGLQVLRPIKDYEYACNNEWVNQEIGYCDVYNNEKYPKTIQLKDAKDPRDFPAIKPEKGETIVDNDLNTKTMQISKPDIVRSHYSKIQSWNADMSLLRIGHRIYDAKTYQETNITKGKDRDEVFSKLCSRAGDYIRWSSKDPHKFYLAQNFSHNLIEGVINGDEVDCNVLDSFDGYEQIFMTLEEGNIDDNDQYVVMLGKKKNDLTMYIIKYDLKNKTRVWVKPLAADDDSWVKIDNIWWPTHIDWISISPSGKYIVRNNARGGDVKRMYVYDKDLNNRKELKYIDNNNHLIPIDGEHGDIGIDTTGHEVWVQYMLQGGEYKQGIYMFRLGEADLPGEAVVTSTNFTGGHIGCRNTKRPGWCYVGPYEHRYGYVFALKLRALKDATNDAEKENVQLFSQTYLKPSRQYDVIYAGTSPDGTKVIFNELFGYGQYDDGRVYEKFNTFVAEVK